MISYHIISYDIISYDMISYHIIWYHSIWYCTIFYHLVQWYIEVYHHLIKCTISFVCSMHMSWQWYIINIYIYIYWMHVYYVLCHIASKSILYRLVCKVMSLYSYPSWCGIFLMSTSSSDFLPSAPKMWDWIPKVIGWLWVNHNNSPELRP